MEATSTTTPQVKTVDEIRALISDNQQAAEDKIQEDMARMQLLKEKYAEAEDRLQMMLLPVADALAKNGLGIQTFSYNKTGMDQSKWKDGDRLNIHITAVPTSEKFKFLTFKGYTKEGSDKNRTRMNEKAWKLENDIKETVGWGMMSVDVNPFSLQVKNQEERKSVLIEIYI